MASGIFALLDDIVALMDDIAISSKIAANKTAGILGDDLAVNAENATGYASSREIPILWSITRGSLLNKLIIVPTALFLNVFLPIAVKAALILGGVYLAYEGVEKILDYFFYKKKKESSLSSTLKTNKNEKTAIKSAITTDFILSIEIVIIALSTVLNKDLSIQIITVSIVSFLATVMVYGIVALIVRMDDTGYFLIKRSKNNSILSLIGQSLVKLLPIIIRVLQVIGTVALIFVAGGIFVHNIDYFHNLIPNVPLLIKEFILGFLLGLIAIPVFHFIKKFIPNSFKHQ